MAFKELKNMHEKETNIVKLRSVRLRNEFNFWNVHGLMKTSGLLQNFERDPKYSFQKLKLLLIFTFYYKYLKYEKYFN